eukprot:1135971-Prymnesium_polylepis.1
MQRMQRSDAIELLCCAREETVLLVHGQMGNPALKAGVQIRHRWTHRAAKVRDSRVNVPIAREHAPPRSKERDHLEDDRFEERLLRSILAPTIHGVAQHRQLDVDVR